jgi:hypothetical protein
LWTTFLSLLNWFKDEIKRVLASWFFPEPLIVGADGQFPPKRMAKRAWVLIFTILSVCMVVGIKFWIDRHPHLRVPMPPTDFKVGTPVIEPVKMAREKIVKLDKEVLPCADGKITGHGLSGLGDLPGGPKLTKPYFLLLPKNAEYTQWSDGSIDLLFEVEITNRGESSIAKDWQLCMVKTDNTPVEFLPSTFIPEEQTLGPHAVSLVDAVYNTPVGHAQTVKGWILFKVPADVPLKFPNMYGKLGCRDYLEHPSSFCFSSGEKK